LATAGISVRLHIPYHIGLFFNDIKPITFWQKILYLYALLNLKPAAMKISSAKVSPNGSEIKIGDFSPGNRDPTTGEKIRYIIYQNSNFIVCIDSKRSLNWYAAEHMKYASDFGEVASQINLTESLVDRIFSGRKNRIAYKKILGDILARLLDEQDSTTARLILDEAKKRVMEHGKERVRMAYINYAVLSVIFIGCLVILTLIFKSDLLEALGQKEIFRIIVCTLLGGVGAFITTFFRFQNYQGSIIAGLPIHRLDGFLRIFYGLIAGIIISLAIKGQVLAGFADTIAQPWILYFFAMVAGASEVLIPNLIKQTENQTTIKPPPPSKETPEDTPDKEAPDSPHAGIPEPETTATPESEDRAATDTNTENANGNTNEPTGQGQQAAAGNSGSKEGESTS
jgi:hypothetical protein